IPRLIGSTVIILVIRRLPIVTVMMKAIPTLRSLREAFFAGWFGPVGITALYFGIIASLNLTTSGSKSSVIPALFPVVSFMVLTSVIVHGITVPLMHISKHINTRTLTSHAPFDHIVRRLPIINPGQMVVINRDDHSPPPKTSCDTYDPSLMEAAESDDE